MTKPTGYVNADVYALQDAVACRLAAFKQKRNANRQAWYTDIKKRLRDSQWNRFFGKHQGVITDATALHWIQNNMGFDLSFYYDCDHVGELEQQLETLMCAIETCMNARIDDILVSIEIMASLRKYMKYESDEEAQAEAG